jgi:hypothetical protein
MITSRTIVPTNAATANRTGLLSSTLKA